MSARGSITLARPVNGSSLAKQISVNLWQPGSEWPGIYALRDPEHVSQCYFRVREFDAPEELLSILRGAAISGEMATRGMPKGPTGRRAVHDDDVKGPAGLVAVPKVEFACDWDALSFPEGSDLDPLLHPGALAELARPWLPPAARDKTMIVQISASAGYKLGARFRTWHMLDEPLNGGDVELWCDPAIRAKKLDKSTLVEAQPIYLAVKVVGGCDPCPERFSLIKGKGGDRIPLDGFRKCKAKHDREKAAEQEVRDKVAAALRARGPSTDGRPLEIAIRKAEAAIAGATEGQRHPSYVEQSARIRAIIERHGGDWASARHRLTAAYESTLSGQERRERAKGSTEGVMRWVETRQ